MVDAHHSPVSAEPSSPEVRERCRSRVVDPSIYFEQEVLRPGMWRYPTSLQHCCIYRVPNSLRDVNPEAYTPQLLLMGPLHHSLKAQASMCNFGDNKITKYMGYLNMEQHKKIYLKCFSQRVKDKVEDAINEFKRIIKENEEMIRGSYSESTTWIQSQDFVEMILHDSVFIFEYVLRIFYKGESSKKTGDVLMDEPMIQNTIFEDLILLENQLPYFILQKLFDPIVPKFFRGETFRDVIVIFFGLEHKIKDDSEFIHFTDLFRCVRVETLNLKEVIGETREDNKSIEKMYSVEKLENAGVKFEVLDKESLSLEVRFEKGCLKLPWFEVDDHVEMRLRNLMAFEQCHYPYEAYVCNFVTFMDFLIDTHKDVERLVEKGIIKNWMGYHGYVAEMVNKLSFGVVDFGSNCYYDAATKANAYCENPINRARAILKRVYFSNLWTETATVAAVFLLLMTFIETVASIIQVIQK